MQGKTRQALGTGGKVACEAQRQHQSFPHNLVHACLPISQAACLLLVCLVACLVSMSLGLFTGSSKCHAHAECDNHPFEVDTMLFMDWRDDHTDSQPDMKAANYEVPTFLYVMPFTENKCVPWPLPHCMCSHVSQTLWLLLDFQSVLLSCEALLRHAKHDTLLETPYKTSWKWLSDGMMEGGDLFSVVST